MMKNINKPQIKNPILGIFTILIGVCINFCGLDNNFEIFSLVMLGIIGIVYVGVLAYFAKEEANSNKVTQLQENEIRAYEEICISNMSIMDETAIQLENMILTMRKKQEIDFRIWNFDSCCKSICRNIYRVLKVVTKKHSYLVNYVKISNLNEREIILNAYANRNGNKPSIFGVARSIDDLSGYYDTLMFKDNKTDIVVVSDKSELNKMLREGSGKDKDKYEQYIGIPVFSDDVKMIGLLQVFSLTGGNLGESKQDMVELASKYLMPFVKFFLLSYKIENILLCNVKETVV